MTVERTFEKFLLATVSRMSSQCVTHYGDCSSNLSKDSATVILDDLMEIRKNQLAPEFTSDGCRTAF